MMKKTVAIFIFLFAVSLSWGAFAPGKLYIRLERGYPHPAAKKELEKYGVRLEEAPLKAESLRQNMRTGTDYDSPAGKLQRTYMAEMDASSDPEKIARKLTENAKCVELAEPVNDYRIQDVPNDPKLGDQKDMLNAIKAKEAWAIYEGSPDVVIAISDNGVNQDHEDIESNLYINEGEVPDNEIDDDGNGYIDDYRGFNFSGDGWGDTFISHSHGTQVCGIAAAGFDNGTGIAGIGGRSRVFPFKTTSATATESVAFGYSSILYAADNGIDVINCSWGSPGKYSEVEQTIIDYAVSKDVVIIVSGGNLEGRPLTTRFYPAAYRGVLGVGEVTAFDDLTAATSMGPHCKILAPGKGNITTALNGGYTAALSGTSFASPVVAGAAALARGRFPELNAPQIIQMLRKSTDDISDGNPLLAPITPGRINLLKLMQADPFAAPGLELLDVRFYDKEGVEKKFFSVGEEIGIRLTLRNHLAAGTGLSFALSIAYDDNDEPLTMVTDELEGRNIGSGETYVLSGFAVKKLSSTVQKIIFRVDVSGPSGYRDFMLFDFIPMPDITDFENESIKFSVVHDGNFGYRYDEDNKYGYGFALKGVDGTMYDAGIFATENDTRAFSASNPRLIPSRSDYQRVSGFTDIDTTGVIRVDRVPSDNPPGPSFRIEQRIFVPSGTEKYTRIELKATNDQSTAVQSMAMGYKFDWDLGGDENFLNNVSELIPDAIPSVLSGGRAAAIMSYNVDSTYAFAIASASFDNSAVAQAAGFTVEDPFNSSMMIQSLSQGTSMVSDEISDIYAVAGMRFDGALQPGQSRECYVCVAAGNTKNDVESQIRACLETTFTSVEEKAGLIVFPNPSRGVINLKADQYESYRVYDSVGRLLLQGTAESEAIDLGTFGNGVYYIGLSEKAHGNTRMVPVIISK